MHTDEIPMHFADDPYAVEYGLPYVKKMQYLEQVIARYETGTDVFRVLNFESGLGKSYETLKILDRYLSDWTNTKKFLIVKKFNRDIEGAIKFLYDRGHTSVLGITSDNWTTNWARRTDELWEFQVIFISHERYMRLCLSEERKYFIEDRDVLIIDEKVTFPIYTFNWELYNRVRSFFRRMLQEEYDKVCRRLVRVLENNEDVKNHCVRVDVDIHPKTILNFRSMVEANWNSIKQSDRETLSYFLIGLSVWYGNKCVYNAGNISGTNPLHRHWGLSNNIILDASADIDGVYKLNPNKFQIMNQGMVVDHSKCSFNAYNFNSSKSSIHRNENELFPEIAQRIKKTIEKTDKILLICHKTNATKIEKHLVNVGLSDVLVHEKEKPYSGQQIVINWYGNIVGRNEYSKFTKCWLIGTPNLPFEQYLVHYQQYSHISFGNKSMELHLGRFYNKTFKSVQEGYIAAEMYQASKRIQRVTVPNGEFNIVSNDPKIVKDVLRRIRGANSYTVGEFEFKAKQDEEKDDKRNAQTIKLEQHLRGLEKGVYQKRDIYDAVGISKGHLSDYLKRDKIVRLVADRVIRVNHRTIERL